MGGMNLISDRWIPVRLQSGKSVEIAPWEITRKDDPVASLDSPRPDFDASIMQFLIGLLQTTFSPDEHERSRRLESPPEPEELKESFSRYDEEIFNIQRFMQDQEPLEDGKTWPISKLFINCPGENALKENKDHFVKRHEIEKVCPRCTVVALWTLQTNAPSGGQGHRTSVRGGGPLSSLVLMDENASDNFIFWQNLWLNVLKNSRHLSSDKNNIDDIFPWMGKTRTSEKDGGVETTDKDVHPLQVYWGMPRRIRIDWNKTSCGKCDVCLKQSNHLASEYKTKKYGVNYTGYWFHPLSPVRTDEKTGERFNKKTKGKILYTNWPDLFLSNKTNANAAVVEQYLHSKPKEFQFCLHIFGYEMNNDKALRWIESKFPLFQIDNSADVEKIIRGLIETSKECAKALVEAGKIPSNTGKKYSKKSPPILKDSFFDRNQDNFFKHIKELPHADFQKRNTIKETWGKHLKKTALELFDLWFPLGEYFQSNAEKIAKARKKLHDKLVGITR